MAEDETQTALLRSLLIEPQTSQLLERRGLSVRIMLLDATSGAAIEPESRADVLEELRAVQRKLEHVRRLATVGVLAAGITHEARNLLTGALGFAQLLVAKSHDPKHVKEMARTIEAETRRCVDILMSFLKLSRAGASPARVLEVSELVTPVERLLSHPLHMRGCTLAVVLEPNLPSVVGCAGDLQRVLINLVLNAADAASSGGHVELCGRRGPNGSIDLCVRDDGPGVSAALAQQIFEPFFSTKPEGTGTGLGLSLSRSIAEAHGGQLLLDAQNDQDPPRTRGASFTVRLPAAESLRVDDAAKPEEPRS
jgi:signal transduction histidine kinase